MNVTKRIQIMAVFVLVLLAAAGCAPGNERFVEGPAGFWAGLWHGLICVVTFIISLFNDTVRMYEVNNTGGWYDFGFLLGASIFFSSGWGPFGWKRRAVRHRRRDWDDIGDRIEEKIRSGIHSFLEESERSDEWKEIARQIEDKIKRELRDWVEK